MEPVSVGVPILRHGLREEPGAGSTLTKNNQVKNIWHVKWIISGDYSSWQTWYLRYVMLSRTLPELLFFPTPSPQVFLSTYSGTCIHRNKSSTLWQSAMRENTSFTDTIFYKFVGQQLSEQSYLNPAKKNKY